MLSKIIAFLSKDSSIKEITNGSNLLIFIAAFITPMASVFMIIGRPYEGIVASLATCISYSYGMRSTIGYIDTDILNLF